MTLYQLCFQNSRERERGRTTNYMLILFLFIVLYLHNIKFTLQQINSEPLVNVQHILSAI
jgi:hypothetical protein